MLTTDNFAMTLFLYDTFFLLIILQCWDCSLPLVDFFLICKQFPSIKNHNTPKNFFALRASLLVNKWYDINSGTPENGAFTPLPFQKGERGRRCPFTTPSQVISWFIKST